MTPDPRPAWTSRSAALALGVLTAGELALVGWAMTTGSGLLFALGQALLLTLLAFIVLVSRFLRYRRAFERAIAESAAEHERSRLAEELHDVLGHELSLVALRASAVQVSTQGETSMRAAELRRQVERVVLELRQTVELLREPQTPSTRPVQLEADIASLTARSRVAGASVELEGRLDDAVPAPVRLTAFCVVREGLTNALKHAPGSAVHVRQWLEMDDVHVQVETGGDIGEDRSTWSGLASLSSRVESLGGSLWTTSAAGRRTLHARIPLQPLPRRPPPARAHPRPVSATVRWGLPPLAAAAVAATAFYTWSTHGATLEQQQFDAITTGAPVDAVLPSLPGRQSAVRLMPAPPTPAGSHCSYFTDGNFPLGMAAYQVCDDGVRITQTTDLRDMRLR